MLDQGHHLLDVVFAGLAYRRKTDPEVARVPRWQRGLSKLGWGLALVVGGGIMSQALRLHDDNIGYGKDIAQLKSELKSETAAAARNSDVVALQKTIVDLIKNQADRDNRQDAQRFRIDDKLDKLQGTLNQVLLSVKK